MKVKNIYPNRKVVELSKLPKDRTKGGLCITINREGGASNYHITKRSFLDFVKTHYNKELNKEMEVTKIEWIKKFGKLFYKEIYKNGEHFLILVEGSPTEFIRKIGRLKDGITQDDLNKGLAKEFPVPCGLELDDPERKGKTMMADKKKYCSCGNPQSYPIPHEHDRTEREKQIIKHFEELVQKARQDAEKNRGIYVDLDYREMELIRQFCREFVYEDRVWNKESRNPHHKVGLANRILDKIESMESTIQENLFPPEFVKKVFKDFVAAVNDEMCDGCRSEVCPKCKSDRVTSIVVRKKGSSEETIEHRCEDCKHEWKEKQGEN